MIIDRREIFRENSPLDRAGDTRGIRVGITSSDDCRFLSKIRRLGYGLDFFLASVGEKV